MNVQTPLDSLFSPSNLSYRDCPLCHTRNKLENKIFTRKDGQKFVKCQSCDLRYLIEVPNQASLDSFYSNYNLSYKKTYSFAQPRHPFSHYMIRRLYPFINNSSNALDVGCGFGDVLIRLSLLGLSCHGVEPDMGARSALLGSEHIDTIYNSMSDIPLENKYDVIILNDVIEHLLDVDSFLKAVLAHASESCIIAIWTPNSKFKSLTNRLIQYEIDYEHLQYFSSETFSYLAAKYGCQIQHLESRGLPSVSKFPDTLREFRGLLSSNSRFSSLRSILQKVKNKFIVTSDYEKFYLDEISNYNSFVILSSLKALQPA